jgi:hypothetical protein
MNTRRRLVVKSSFGVGARAVSEAQSAVVGPSDELGSPHETESYAC